MSAIRGHAAHRRPDVGIAALAVLAVLVVAGLVTRLGLAGLLVPLAGVGALLLVGRPALALGLFCGLLVLVESAEDGGLLATDALYDAVPGGATPAELLLVLAVGAVFLDVIRRGEALRLPVALAFPLALFVLAIASGSLVGLFAGVEPGDLVSAARHLPFLVIVPLLVVQLVRTERDARVALAWLAALAVLKALVGVAGVATGRGADVELDGASITFYAPVGNALALLVLLGVVAALLSRTRLPVWLLLGSPLLVLSLALSQRRSFWVGAVLGLLLVVALGSTPVGRRLFLPTAVLVAASLWALSSVGFQAEGPLVERARSLEPSRVATNAEDRYRFDERTNVLEELRRHPLTGLGIGVPWSARHPVGLEHSRQYAHMVVLWQWLKLGLIGLAAYAAIMLAAGRAAWLAWRRHRDPVLRAAGLAALCWLVAMAVVETTASFTGVDPRFTVLMGVVLGLLIAMRPATLNASSAVDPLNAVPARTAPLSGR